MFFYKLNIYYRLENFMLNKNFRYVSLDFETTWLDTKKDEIIQVWFIEIDIDWKSINEFKSFVKPQKQVDNLKDIVSYITWIDVETINKASSIFDIQDKVLEFFGEDVILIWHNVSFDIDMIKRYFPDISYYDSMDTFSMAQNLVHFAPSYALDVLVEHLISKDKLKEIFENIHGWIQFDWDNAHDALYDAKNAMVLFVYFISKIVELTKDYGILINFLSKNTWLYNKIIKTQSDRASKKNSDYEFPFLEKKAPSSLSLKSSESINLKEFENKSKFYVWNVHIRHFVQKLVSWNKKLILSFSSIPKLNIVKNMLYDLGIRNIGFARGQQIFDKTKFKSFLNKETFSDNEFMFLCKYLSHHQSKLSLLDLNTKFDYKISYYINSETKKSKYPVFLTTHWGLFSMMDDKVHDYSEYDICFFDVEMWYKSYNSYLSRPVDLYNISTSLENIYYKYTLDNNLKAKDALDSFARFFGVFMGILFSETKKKFIKVDSNNISINPILDSIDFYETNALLKKFDQHKVLLEELLGVDDFGFLWSKIDHMFSVFWWLIKVDMKMYGQSDFYFIYSESSQFTDWNEFKDIFDNHTLFLSDSQSGYKTLDNSKYEQQDLSMMKIHNIRDVYDYLDIKLDWKKDQIVFILSTIKAESKEMFEYFYNNWIHTKPDLLVENITWSLGKNVFKAKKNWSKIIVGWYNFLMWLFSNNIDIDIYIEFNIKWKMAEYLLDDIKWYAKYDK